MLQIVAEPLRTDALVVVIEEGADREAEGCVRIARRRLQEKEDAEDVGDEDERGEAADDVEVAVAVVSDDVAQQLFEAADHELEHLLEVAGIFAADAAGHQRKDDRADEQNHQRHDDVIGDVPGERVLHAVPQRVDRCVKY